MNDYMTLRLSSIDYFIQHLKSAPKFYQAIRENTLMVNDYKPDFVSASKKLKAVYPQALFPDVYLIIGAFTNAGTVLNAVLLIVVNQAS